MRRAENGVSFFDTVPALTLVALLGVVGCGGGDEGSPTGSGGSSAGSGGSAGKGGSSGSAGKGGSASGGSGGSASGGSGGTITSLSDGIAVKDVEPGSEAHVCITKRLANDKDVWVNRLRATISGGSHHFIIDRDRGNVEVLEPVQCIPLSGTDASRILIAQQHETDLALPDGVAFRIPARQLVTLELHYFNTTPDPIDVEATFSLDILSDGSQPEAAEMLFTGTNDIMIPPHAQSTSTFFGVPDGTASDPTQMFGVTSHTHSRGVRATIERAASRLAPGELLHESLNWAEPPLDYFTPPLAFTGQDGIRLTCQYENTTNAAISFGTSVDEEMCFMWLYYYPARGSLF